MYIEMQIYRFLIDALFLPRWFAIDSKCFDSIDGIFESSRRSFKSSYKLNQASSDFFSLQGSFASYASIAVLNVSKKVGPSGPYYDQGYKKILEIEEFEKLQGNLFPETVQVVLAQKLMNWLQLQNFKVQQDKFRPNYRMPQLEQEQVKSDISVQYKKQLKTEDTAEPSMNYTNKNQKSNQPKHRLIKHDRLLRYSKLNRFNQIIKSGFYYDKQDIDVIDDDKNTALFYAAGFGNFVLVDFLLKNGADPNLQCSDGTPMHQAIKSQSLDVIFRMIDEGGSLNVLNSQNNTPLIYATTSLLKQLGMENAIVTTSSQIPVFDNNELLYK
ncbi:hypothetical protein pb186bvf_013408 [Paramecium bursaria]